jgi:hypothetical protein
MNLVNLWQRILSMSSLCLILIDIRSELMDPSIKTCSFSFLEIITGVNKVSGENLFPKQINIVLFKQGVPGLHFGLVMPLYVLRSKVL